MLSQVITTKDGPSLILMLGGPAAVRAGLFTAQQCLHRARVDLARLRANRGAEPEWMRGFYPSSRRYGLDRIKRCRAAVAKCQQELAWLEAAPEPFRPAAE